MLMQEKINGISSIYFEVEFWYHIGHHITSTPVLSHVHHVQVMSDGIGRFAAINRSYAEPYIPACCS